MAEKGNPLVEAVEDFLDALKNERGASDHTILAYRADLYWVSEFLASAGLTAWSEMTPAHFLKLENKKSIHEASASVRRRLAAVRSLLRFLKRQDTGPICPIPRSVSSYRTQVLPKWLPRDEVNALLESVTERDAKGLRDRAILEVLYGCGLRVSEAVELPLEGYIRESKVLRVTGKRLKTRLVPVPAETLMWIESYLESSRYSLIRAGTKRATPYLFLNDHGGKILRQNVLKIVSKGARRAGITKTISPHTLRHSYAVHLLEGGADLRVVQELLGHESLGTTQIYTMLDSAKVRAEYLKRHPRG